MKIVLRKIYKKCIKFFDAPTFSWLVVSHWRCPQKSCQSCWQSALTWSFSHSPSWVYEHCSHELERVKTPWDFQNPRVNFWHRCHSRSDQLVYPHAQKMLGSYILLFQRVREACVYHVSVHLHPMGRQRTLKQSNDHFIQNETAPY